MLTLELIRFPCTPSTLATVNLTDAEKLVKMLECSSSDYTQCNRQHLKSSLMEMCRTDKSGKFMVTMPDGSKIYIKSTTDTILTFVIVKDGKKEKKYLLFPTHPAWKDVEHCICMAGIIDTWKTWATATAAEDEFRQDAYTRLRFCIMNSGITLALSGMGLTSLPPLPEGLVKLDISYNKMKELPVLPKSLQILDVSFNHLTAQPKNKGNLKFINIANNHLTAEREPVPEMEQDVTIKTYSLQPAKASETVTPNATELLTLLKKTGKYTNDDSLQNTVSPEKLAILAAWRSWMYESTPSYEQRGVAFSRLKECLLKDKSDLSLCALKLSTLPPMPPHLLSIDLSDNYLTEIPYFSSKLKILRARNNKFTKIELLPVNLTLLDLRNNKIFEITRFPPALTYLNIRANRMSKLATLPKTLTILKAQHNLLSTLPCLPPRLIKIYVSNNRLNALPRIPGKIKFLDVAHNFLTELPPIPGSMIGLDASFNQLTEQPVITKALQYCDIKFNQIVGELKTKRNHPGPEDEFSDTESIGNEKLMLSRFMME